MIVTARKYCETVLKEIGIEKIFLKLSDLNGAMKPNLWGMIENPAPEDYVPNHCRELFTDQEKRRTYHIKDYDVTAILIVRIGGTKDEIVNQYKRAFLKKLKRWIADEEGYLIEVTPVNSDLNPAESELPNDPHILLQIRFSGGVWKKEETALIQEAALLGEIVKNPKELEEMQND